MVVVVELVVLVVVPLDGRRMVAKAEGGRKGKKFMRRNPHTHTCSVVIAF